MYEQNFIKYLRQFFLDNPGKFRRHAYTDSLSEEIRKPLLDFENSFIRHGVASDGIQELLRTYQLESFAKEVNQIQAAFYLNVSEQALKQPDDEDHITLVNAKNPSYSFLVDDNFEKDLETILTFKDRDTIREKVKLFEQQRLASESKNKSPFVIIRPLLRYASIAVAASLVLLLWQPFHEGNNDLFNSYISTDDQIETGVPPGGVFYDRENGEGSIRGQTDNSLRGLSEIEKAKAYDAYSLFKKQSYQAAAREFLAVGISPAKGRKFLIYLAIAQLRTNDLENAKNNLQTVLAFKDSTQYDSALFYLALYYLKTGDRSEARQRLTLLQAKSGPYQDESAAILKKMRWF